MHLAFFYTAYNVIWGSGARETNSTVVTPVPRRVFTQLVYRRNVCWGSGARVVLLLRLDMHLWKKWHSLGYARWSTGMKSRTYQQVQAWNHVEKAQWRPVPCLEFSSSVPHSIPCLASPSTKVKSASCSRFARKIPLHEVSRINSPHCRCEYAIPSEYVTSPEITQNCIENMNTNASNL